MSDVSPTSFLCCYVIQHKTNNPQQLGKYKACS